MAEEKGKERKEPIEDDDKETVTLMIEHRLPWLIIGMFGGIGATLLSAKFEALLATNIRLAFFIPVIVYMADAVGTQTETVYVRNLTTRTVKFHTYLLKEFILGNVIGLFFGVGIALFAYMWFKDIGTAFTVGYSMFATMGTAPLVALIVPTIIKKEHKDPAVGAGPFTTVIQDLLSLLIYFYIASIIILK
jgi:magnesium transporter